MTAKRSTTSVALMTTLVVAFAMSVIQIVMLERDTIHVRAIEQQLQQVQSGQMPGSFQPGTQTRSAPHPDAPPNAPPT